MNTGFLPDPRFNSRFESRGLTLLELLIVISILAILTTIATRSLVSVGEQSQFDANDALARDFRRSLVGTPGAVQSDGTPSISGLIADLGRPPRAELEPFIVGENEAVPSMTGNAYTLREMVVQRTSPPFKFYVPNISSVTRETINTGVTNLILYDGTNQVPFGWRGPYLQTGSDAIIKDAWGKPLAAYSEVAERNLIDFWTTSYTTNAVFPPVLLPLAGIPVDGYHSADNAGYGSFPLDVVGIVIRPGPSSFSAAGASLSLAAYSNAFSAGIVFNNEYIAQLACSIKFNTNIITDPNFTSDILTNYWFFSGVLMYGPNPNFGSIYATGYAADRPVGVAYLATGTQISGAGITGGLTVPYPANANLVFTNFPCTYTSGTGATYPLVHGPRVVKPFLVAKRKNGVSAALATTDIALWTGPARNLTLRPGYNSVQLTVP